jgi:hypothetical protein
MPLIGRTLLSSAFRRVVGAAGSRRGSAGQLLRGHSSQWRAPWIHPIGPSKGRSVNGNVPYVLRDAVSPIRRHSEAHKTAARRGTGPRLSRSYPLRTSSVRTASDRGASPRPRSTFARCSSCQLGTWDESATCSLVGTGLLEQSRNSLLQVRGVSAVGPRSQIGSRAMPVLDHVIV